MQEDDDHSYLPRQLDAEIRLGSQGAPTLCVTSGIGREALLIRGAPRLPVGSEVQLTLTGDRRDSLTIRCLAGSLVGGDQLLSYEGLSFDERVRLEELAHPHWDGVDLFDGLMTMACIYGPTSLKDWLCMTRLLEQIQPRLLNRQSSLA